MIDLGVMNNFSHNEQATILENLTRRVRQIDCAFDAVAKTKLLRQAHCRISNGNDSAGTPDLFDNIAAVVGLDLLLHGRHHVRRTQIDLLVGSRAAGNQVRAHSRIVILSVAKNLRSAAQSDSQRCFASLNMTHWSEGGNALRLAYSSRGPLGFSNAASETITEAGGSGVLESSTRCTFGPIVSSSGWALAMSTGVPMLTSA